MKHFALLLVTCFIYTIVIAQPNYYAAAKNGLSIREQPNVSAKVLDKIPYGQKLQLLKDTAELKSISVEGFTGYWWQVKFNDKTGYIVSSYVLQTPPPGSGIKKLEEY